MMMMIKRWTTCAEMCRIRHSDCLRVVTAELEGARFLYDCWFMTPVAHQRHNIRSEMRSTGSCTTFSHFPTFAIQAAVLSCFFTTLFSHVALFGTTILLCWSPPSLFAVMSCFTANYYVYYAERQRDIHTSKNMTTNNNEYNSKVTVYISSATQDLMLIQQNKIYRSGVVELI